MATPRGPFASEMMARLIREHFDKMSEGVFWGNPGSVFGGFDLKSREEIYADIQRAHDAMTGRKPKPEDDLWKERYNQKTITLDKSEYKVTDGPDGKAKRHAARKYHKPPGS